jgi:hypothetical protein
MNIVSCYHKLRLLLLQPAVATNSNKNCHYLKDMNLLHYHGNQMNHKCDHGSQLQMVHLPNIWFERVKWLKSISPCIETAAAFTINVSAMTLNSETLLSLLPCEDTSSIATTSWRSQWEDVWKAGGIHASSTHIEAVYIIIPTLKPHTHHHHSDMKDDVWSAGRNKFCLVTSWGNPKNG